MKKTVLTWDWRVCSWENGRISNEMSMLIKEWMNILIYKEEYVENAKVFGSGKREFKKKKSDVFTEASTSDY